MNDPNATVTPSAPTVTVDPQKPAVAPALPATLAAPAAPAATDTDKDPQWLGARLERERQKMLKDLGVESVDDAKKAIADLNAKRDAEKTAAQKATEAESALKVEKAKSDEMAKTLGAYAKSKLASLTDAQRNAVLAIAGEDASKQLTAIETLSPTWASPSAPPAAPVKPADTAPAPSAPKDGTLLSPTDHKAIHAEMVKTNPVIAARYALAHGLFDNK